MTESILTEGAVKLIPLGKSGKFAIVDEEDYEWLSQWKWHLDKDGYAVRRQWQYATEEGENSNTEKKYVSIRMHKEINQTPKGFDTDHINWNKADNRRSNLRTATRAENIRNQGLRRSNSSGFTGVYWDKNKQKWSAKSFKNGKEHYIGRFANKEDAIAARKTWELSHQSSTEP